MSQGQTPPPAGWSDPRGTAPAPPLQQIAPQQPAPHQSVPTGGATAPTVTTIVAIMVVIGVLVWAGVTHRVHTAVAPPPPTAPSSDPGADPAEPAPTSEPAQPLSGSLVGGGSGLVVQAMFTWTDHLREKHPELTIEYEPVGSGAARESFLDGQAQYAILDRPLGADERPAAACTVPAINLPIVAGPIVVVANVPGVDELALDAATLAGIYTGSITRWNDDRIVALNPGKSLPDLEVIAIYRADNANINETVTGWLHASETWGPEPSTTWTEDHGEGLRGTGPILERVSEQAGAISYVAREAATTDVMWLSLINADGQRYAVDGPQTAAQIDKSPKAPGRSSHDHARDLDSTVAGAYPLLQVSYLVVCEQYEDPADAELVRGAFGWILSPEGHSTAQPEGTAAFSDQLYADLAASIAAVS